MTSHPVGLQQLYREQPQDPHAENHEPLAQFGFGQPDSLQSNGSQYGERRGLVADVVRDFGPSGLRGRPDEFGVAPIADHPIPRLDAGDVRSDVQNDAGVAVSERHGFVELAEHGFQSRCEAVRAYLVEHLFDPCPVGSGPFWIRLPLPNSISIRSVPAEMSEREVRIKTCPRLTDGHGTSANSIRPVFRCCRICFTSAGRRFRTSLGQ